MPLLEDDRWYHSLDKGYGGRAVYDPDGLADALARWLAANRFEPEVVRFRLSRARREFHQAARSVEVCLKERDPWEATKAVRSAVKWLQTWLLETWGERDSSLGRVGTRFERLARLYGRPDLVDGLNALSDLDDASVERRTAAAPDWARERHERQWRARRHIGEEVTRLQDARDVLRVCSLYAMRRMPTRPFPPWLAVPEEIGPIEHKSGRLSALIGVWDDNAPLPARSEEG